MTSASCSKILNDKNSSIQCKILGQLVFFRASASFSKILNDKKLYIQYREFNASPALRQAQVAQKS